jgi:hypothetical protein
MSSPALDMRENPSASLVLERLLLTLPPDRVSLGWLHEELREYSFELIAFILALIGVLPGASWVVGPLLIVPAIGMMSSSVVDLPKILAARSISARHASFVLGRAIPVLRRWETPDRERNAGFWRGARPVAGLFSLLLAITLLVPIPLSNVLPALVIAGLTLASFEKNATLLCLSGLAAAVSLGVTCVTVMAASQAFANFAF